MTQALAAYNEQGVILATDSRASRFDATGRAECFALKKLLPLGRHAALLSGGAGVSVPLSLALRREIGRRRGLDHPEDMVYFARHFLSKGYQRHLERHGSEPEGFRRIYFILAGYAADLPPPGFSLYLLGSEENELPLKNIPTGNQVVMPRNLGMEMRLVKAMSLGVSLEELLALSKGFLEKMAAAREEVGPPFYFATITAAGYREVLG